MGCSKDSASVNALAEVQSMQEPLLTEFASILSSAVSNEPEVRSFLKTEALKQFDNDYDVFYPYVKDNVVYDGRTFREIIKRYDINGQLDNIETEERLLTILVPDCSWVSENCFSPATWDVTDNQILVAVSARRGKLPVYSNGKYCGDVNRNDYPLDPILVVKRNERVIYNPTKSSVYEFVDPEYDGSVNAKTKGTWHSQDYEYSTTTPNDYVLYYNFPTKVKQAYYEAANTSSMPQRDYIYYNMTASSDTGSLDVHFWERLFKFKFSEGNVSALYNSQSDYSHNHEGWPGTDYSQADLKLFGWDDGNLDIVFHVITGNEESSYHKNVLMKDAFAPKKVHSDWYVNFFGAVTYRYYQVEYSDLVPKWIMLNINLFNWSLKNNPYSYKIKVQEFDSTTTSYSNENGNYEYVTNVSVSGDEIKVGWGIGITNTNTYNQTALSERTTTYDELGQVWVHYIDPIILNIPDPACKIFRYTTGAVDFMIIPSQVY